MGLIDVLREMRVPGPTADSEGVKEEMLTDAQASRLLDALDQDVRPMYEEALLRQRVCSRFLTSLLHVARALVSTLSQVGAWTVGGIDSPLVRYTLPCACRTRACLHFLSSMGHGMCVGSVARSFDRLLR